MRYHGPDGEGELLADLTFACDGRWSVVREQAGLRTREWSVPFDVWWFRLPRDSDAQYSLIPRMAPGRLLIMIPREGYFQIAYLIGKGRDAELRARGLAVFRDEVAGMVPEAHVDGLQSWDDVKFLDVRLNRLRRWHTEGLLCIGDAAHAMSPAGGVGINLAVQDAVGAAALLADPLRRGVVRERDLAAVQRRRMPAAVFTQGLQRLLHRRLMGPILGGRLTEPPAALLDVVRRLPWLTAVPAHVVGVGVRPEHAPPFARRLSR